ncbi:MAG TPA: hypothetical protein VFV17_08595 [Usitatibacteraceae bacterium]|nr:hypothetical protein [Usitatibacteraceae bacterium]
MPIAWPIARQIFAVLLASTLLGACNPSTHKLDEAPIHDGPLFRVKLVRYYENLPFHYTGEVFRVQCASAATANSPAHKMQEAGWVTIGNGGAIGTKSAAEVAARERAHYRVIDERTLVWVGNGVNVSFDACGQFRGWVPTDVPESMIEPAAKPDYCRPKGTADCRWHDFMGARAPRYEDIRVEPGGRIAFTVHSTAFRGAPLRRVHSEDFGRTWVVKEP